MKRTLLTICLAVLFAARSSAHHAFEAEYDGKKLVTVSGTATRFNWTNPHAWLYVTGKDETGRESTWGFEMGAPGGLISRGWKRGELKQGDEITIDGYCAKSGKDVANARIVTLPDCRKLFGGFKSTPRDTAKPSKK